MGKEILKKKDFCWKIILFWGILICSIVFFNTPGTGDMSIWMDWIEYADQYGVKEGYRLQRDMYPPFALIIQIILKKIYPMLSSFVALRVVNIFFLLISTLLIQILYRREKITLIFFGALVLSTNLGYLDIEMVPFFVLAFHFISKDKYVLSGIFYTLLCLVKFQPLIILPYIVLYFVDIFDVNENRFQLKLKWKKMMGMAIPPIIIGGVVCIFYKGAPIKALMKALFKSGSVISPNGLNFGWVVQFILEKFYPDLFGTLDNGKITIIWDVAPIYQCFKYIFVILYLCAVILLFLHRKKTIKLVLQCSLIGYTAYFLFNSGVHENHLFLGMILMILLYLHEPIQTNYFRMLLYIIIFNFNLLILYGMSGWGMGFDRAINSAFDPTLLIAVFNVISLTITIIQIICEVNKGNILTIKRRDINE